MKVVIALNRMSLNGDLLLAKKIIYGNELNLKIYLCMYSTWRNADTQFIAKYP